MCYPGNYLITSVKTGNNDVSCHMSMSQVGLGALSVCPHLPMIRPCLSLLYNAVELRQFRLKFSMLGLCPRLIILENSVQPFPKIRLEENMLVLTMSKKLWQSFC